MVDFSDWDHQKYYPNDLAQKNTPIYLIRQVRLAL